MNNSLKLLSAAFVLAQVPFAQAFDAKVEATPAHELLITWHTDDSKPVDVWVEYRHERSKPTRQLVSAKDADGKHTLAAGSERPYVIVVTADNVEHVVAERLLPLEGGNNFRDLGGYTTAQGHTVKWGQLYRSGTMVDLTANDYRYLNELGIRTVCDFRSTEERTSEPTQWQGESKPQRQEIDYVMDMTTSLVKSLAKPGLTADEVKQVFADFYKDVPVSFAAHYRTMFAELVAGHAPLAFNCSAGKDRTGVGAALLLTALGVPREQVVADYMLSNRYYKQKLPKPGSNDANSRMLSALPPDVIKVLMGVEPMYVEAAFASIEQRYGSVNAYFERELGVDATALAALRKRYTE